MKADKIYPKFTKFPRNLPEFNPKNKKAELKNANYGYDL